ncbi:MAG: winged helix-turn-helix transcriptional regulator [Candidatus Nanoarchaeia archaeon]
MENNATCEFLELLHFFGKKWSVVLLYKLAEKPNSFNDLKTISKRVISPILLSERLKAFCEFGLAEKRFYKDRYVYFITDEGRSLSKFLKKFKSWANEHNYNTNSMCYEKKCCCECLFGGPVMVWKKS